MPTFQFTFTIDGITVQKATAIRDRIAQKLGDEGVQVSSLNSTQQTRPFRVIGVDTQTRERFDVTVDATDQQDAEGQVTTATPTRAVALVIGGQS